jgi:hypothetical protein
MSHPTKPFSDPFPPLDSGSARTAFLLTGGFQEVEEAGKRRKGFEFKILVAITVFSILIGVVWLSSKVSLQFGLLAGFAGLLAVAIGSAIFSLAQSSFSCQKKAGKAIETTAAKNHFSTKELRFSQRLTSNHIFILYRLARNIILDTIQRSIESLAGIVHIGLTRRLLPTPACLR